MEPAPRQLDLRNCAPGFTVDRVGLVSGLRSSAAFFTFLRANLVLSPSAIASNSNTSYFEPYTTQLHHNQLPSSPSPLAANPHLASNDDVPALSLDLLTTTADMSEALRLVADSVSQQEHRAAKILLSHPLCIVALTVTCAVVFRVAHETYGNTGLGLVLACGLIFTFLGAVRWCTAGYSALAKNINWSWLDSEADQFVMLGARRGGRLVGAVVLALENNRSPSTSPRRRNRNRSSSLRGGKGVIRAWTTDIDHRGQGIGTQLLEVAVRTIKDRCGRDARVGFAQEHANSTILLPNLFAGPLRRDENRAAKVLGDMVAEWEASKRKKW
ncbi:hypothetical protein HIM_00520 [Hirsutella minnesotensis 3608]|nr:hypothetical protein HIM_00520 [Hirsutella minnesotensis 3608]